MYDIDAVMGFFVHDCILEMPRGPDPRGRRLTGREQVRAGPASRFAGIPDVHYGEDRHWVAGNRGCSEWLLRGPASNGERIEVMRLRSVRVHRWQNHPKGLLPEDRRAVALRRRTSLSIKACLLPRHASRGRDYR